MPDRDFYLRRAAQESELRLNASTPAIADAHRQLEAAYRAKLDGTAVAKRRASVIAAVDDLRASGLWSNPT